MTVTGLTAPPRATPRLVYRPQDDKILVYNHATDQLHLLSQLGAGILRRCDGTRTLADLAAEVFPPGSAGAERGDRLVGRYLDELRDRKLLALDDPPDTP